MKRTKMPRWIEHHMTASERPFTFYEFYVTGVGQFPWDMLRYDQCWPASSEDVAMMDLDHGLRTQRRSIKMHSYHPPTLDRWWSFLWSIGSEKL